MLKKSFLSWIIVLAFLLLEALFVNVRAYNGFISVPADYPTIQEAINAATPGSVIFVSSGIYYEHLVVDKTLHLVGEDRANTIIDGSGNGSVIKVIADNIVVENFTIRKGELGVKLEGSYNSTISGNVITLHKGDGIQMINSTWGVVLDNIITRCGTFVSGPLLYGGALNLINSSHNVIEGNVLTDNIVYGLILQNSTYNQIYKNTIANGEFGIFLTYSTWNSIHHNNFINNSDNIFLYGSYDNLWDDGYEGNYWDSYNGLDDGSGGRVAGDGVGDTEIPHFGVDNYPLINPHDAIPIVWENVAYHIGLFSNSTISLFRFVQAEKKLTFTLTRPPNTIGFCNVTIPKNLLRGNPWKITLNNMDIEAIITENETSTFINFTYNYTACTVQIIGAWVVPEFPSALALSFLLLLIVAIAISHKKVPHSIRSRRLRA